jgi:hypothetical protein
MPKDMFLCANTRTIDVMYINKHYHWTPHPHEAFIFEGISWEQYAAMNEIRDNLLPHYISGFATI